MSEFLPGYVEIRRDYITQMQDPFRDYVGIGIFEKLPPGKSTSPNKYQCRVQGLGWLSS